MRCRFVAELGDAEELEEGPEIVMKEPIAATGLNGADLPVEQFRVKMQRRLSTPLIT